MLNDNEYYEKIIENLNNVNTILIENLNNIQDLFLNNSDIIDIRIILDVNSFFINLFIRDEFGDSKEVFYKNEEIYMLDILNETILFNYENETKFHDFIYSDNMEERADKINLILFNWFIEIWKKIKKDNMKNIYLTVDNDYIAYDLINNNYKNDEERFKLDN